MTGCAHPLIVAAIAASAVASAFHEAGVNHTAHAVVGLADTEYLQVYDRKHWQDSVQKNPGSRLCEVHFKFAPPCQNWCDFRSTRMLFNGQSNKLAGIRDPRGCI